MKLNFFIDAKALAAEMKNFQAEVERAIEDSVKSVAAMTHAKVVELATEKLNTRRRAYLDNLDFEEVVPGVWVISLDDQAMWIEEGRKSGDMTEDLLRKGAKTAKDGSRYKAIPFDQAKPPSQTSQFGKEMVRKLKSELKKYGVPYKKLEYNADGSPRIGKLHEFNIESPRPTSRASTPALYGVSIYQSMGKSGRVKRDIMTFRMVSSKHKGTKWIHPGLDGEKFFEQAYEWATQTFEKEILPKIYEKFNL